MKIDFNKPSDLGHRGSAPGWRWLGALAGLLALGPSCAGQIPEPTEAHALAVAGAYPGATASSLSEGRRLFIDRCSGCHALPSPASRPASSWPAVVSSMAPLAHLGDPQRASIEAYLVSVAPRQ